MSIETLVQALTDAEVEFIIIGGVSAIIHGSAYNTEDLDIFFSRHPANLGRLARALAPSHPRPVAFPAGLPFVWDEATLRNGTLFTLKTDLGRIDLLAEVSGIGAFQDVWQDSPVVELYGRRVRTLSLPSLIATKRAAGRVKDHLVLPELESLLEAQEE